MTNNFFGLTINPFLLQENCEAGSIGASGTPDPMDAQEFLKGLINCYRSPDEYCAPLIRDVQETEGGLLLTFHGGEQWRIDAVCVSQNTQDEPQAD